jgi:hypothetical protein
VSPQHATGARGFGDDFWRANYADPDNMDGVANAVPHATYLKSSFDVAMQSVESIADFGFGLGHLFEAVLKAFQPYKALGIEPSVPAFEAVRFRLVPPTRTNLKLETVDLVSWCRRPDHPKLRHELGLCTSVFQYLTDDELIEIVPVLARRLQWLYFAVPTEAEYDRLVVDTGFQDPWAIRRPVGWYRELLSPHFERVGQRLLESRVNVPEARSPFVEELFRGW